MLLDAEFMPPDDIAHLTEEEQLNAPWKMEYDIFATLSNMGHEVLRVGLLDDLMPLRKAVDEFKPHVCFNLLEGFRDFHVFDANMVSYLELLNQRYTGCNPRGLMLARDKALTKKILAYHRIRVPQFHVFPKGRKIAKPKKLPFPLLIKSVNVEGSVGISQASVVWDEEKLVERVQYVHDSLGTSAIAEQYIEGRELYVGVLGNQRLLTFPTWEMIFEHPPEGAVLIATEKVKFDPAFQKRWGITTERARHLPEHVREQIPRLAKRIYRLLNLTGYARLDFRLNDAGELYLLEANPNPQLGYGEDFAESAEAAGIKYEPLMQQILTLGMTYRPESLS
jgi:D-alanine-D-alanine ligase